MKFNFNFVFFIFAERKFLFISKKDCTSVFQTEEWQSSGSVLFLPLNEDILVNTQNIEQFSCGQEGNFFVADQNGQYSKTITGNSTYRLSLLCRVDNVWCSVKTGKFEGF